MIELIIICVIVGAGFFFQKKYKPTTTKYASTAYVLWFFSIFGLLGFHRHYLGKYGTGCLWMFTCGCFGIGALVDLFTLSNQVNNHNTALRANLFSQTQNQQRNTQINFQATSYNQTTAQQIKPLQSHNAAKKEQPIKQELASDIIKTVNRTQTHLQAIEVIEESSTIVVQHLSRDVGKITKLSGKIGSGELKLFIALPDWKKLPLNFLPTLSFEFELDNKYNLLIVHSSNKTIASLKKGDSLKICFEDGSFIEKKFGAGRNLNGKSVNNVIFLTDLELKTLSENTVNGIENLSVLRMPFEFTEIKNEQYETSGDGKQLFKIICQKLVEVNQTLKKTINNHSLLQSSIEDNNETLINSTLSDTTPSLIIENTHKEIGSVIQSSIEEKEETVSNSISTDAISSTTIENTDREIGSVIQSFTDSKKTDTIESVSEIPEDDSIIDITDETYIIKADTDLIKYMPGVPYWPHQYVYSFSELTNATPAQKQFYFYFKNSFLTGVYYDLEGNSNYCFILLFNLLDEYDGHKSMTLLEKNLDILGTYYPKTKSYAASFLRAKKNVNITNTDSSSFTGEERYNYHNSFIDYDTFN